LQLDPCLISVLPLPAQEPLSLPFLKKYLAFAKQRFAAPELSPEASDAIAGAALLPAL
jgi:DNA replicative helicase MCM subunit Mcm2 (Cdc46/Mcm family)